MQPIRADILLAGLAPEGQLSSEPIALVTTDSRAVQPGCVFVAFPGARFDGHDFAAQAAAQGAAYVVVNHPVDGVPAQKQLVCPDSYQAMMAIGANYRARFAPTLIGVTGSVGKTTTKEFCYGVLSAFGPALRTEGNQNNELGLPNTLLRLDRDVRYGVVELGMSHLGEISRLARCARPAAGVITCIGVSHLENLGTRENICKAKLEICDGLPHGAPLVLNGDDEYLRAASLPGHVRPAWFALDDQTADVRAIELVQTGEETAFTLVDRQRGRFAVHIPAIGRHNVRDALAAYTAATRLGLDPARAAAALAEFRQTGMRQRVVHHGGVTIIEDCYNANPDSMRAALEMFRAYPAARRFALLGDMLELGEISAKAHEKVGELAADSNLEQLVAYGPLSADMVRAARQNGLAATHVESYRQAADLLRQTLRPGDALLVKASRSIALENVLQMLYRESE